MELTHGPITKTKLPRSVCELAGGGDGVVVPHFVVDALEGVLIPCFLDVFAEEIVGKSYISAGCFECVGGGERGGGLGGEVRRETGKAC